MQDRAIADVREAFRTKLSVLLFGPCGFGKTVIFCWLAWRVIEKGGRVVIICHRDELVGQISRTLDDFNVPHTYCAAGYPYDSRFSVVVASAMTLVRRLNRIRPPTLLIIDEAHHAVGGNTWGQIIAHWAGVKRLGVSATPVRADGRGLGELFEVLIHGPSTRTLIEHGWLSQYRLFVPPAINTEGLHMRAGDFAAGELEQRSNKPSVTGDAVAHYERLAVGKRAVVFCVSVAHAEGVAAAFRRAGRSAACIDGSMDKELRRQTVRQFSSGDLKVLTSCALVNEGFDCPGIEVALSLRPTMSEGLWLQQVGRALRIAEGKEKAIILDHAGNTHRFGLPDADRTWTLEGLQRDTKRAAAMKRCAICFATTYVSATKCSECGHIFVSVSRVNIRQVDGDLEEVEAEAARVQSRVEQAMAGDRDGLIQLGRMRGYKSPEAWADAIIHARRNPGGKKQKRLFA